jgi:lipoyl(octanoyl) transferase
MDLSPFQAIDPCGHVGLEVSQTKDLGINKSPAEIGESLLQKIIENFKL